MVCDREVEEWGRPLKLEIHSKQKENFTDRKKMRDLGNGNGRLVVRATQSEITNLTKRLRKRKHRSLPSFISIPKNVLS
jgi:hypothetical protein